MKRFLIAVVLCALTTISGAWTLQWTADSSWPAGTTVTACLNGECVNGITGSNQSFSADYQPGAVLHGTAQAIPPVGYQCGDPLTDCPPSSVAEIAQTIPSDQESPTQAAWTTSTNGNAMAGFNFVTGSFVIVSDEPPSNLVSANTAIAAQSGDVILAVITFDSSDSPTISSVTSPNTTWTEVIDFSHTGNNQAFKLWKGLVTGSVTSGSAITVTFSTVVHYQSIQVALFRSDNGSAAQPVQLANSTLYAALANPTSTDGMAVTVAPTGSNALTIIEILEIEDDAGSTAASSPGTGFTQISEGWLFSGVGPYLWAIKTGASSGSQSVTATYAQPCPYNSSILAVVLEGGSSSSQTYNYSGSGGFVIGGSAALKRTQTSTANGGISTGGAAALKRAFSNQASGGITTGGAASASQSSGNSYTASGGVTTGGSATLKRTQASTANGGISTGGAGGLKLVKAVSGSGGVATSGAAVLKRAFARSASGGLVTGGTAPLKLVKTTTASGGITTGGAATLKRTQATTASGGITTGGAATLKRTQATTATGGIVTGGAAIASKTSPGQNSYTASGGVTTGGAATLKRTQTTAGTGGIATGGAATLKRVFARLASGGLSTGGAATLKQIRAYLASGGLSTGGAASVTLTAGAFSYVASGGIAAGGSASLRILLHYLASGGVTIGGAASAYTWSSVMALPHGDPAFARLSPVAAMERITPLARVA